MNTAGWLYTHFSQLEYVLSACDDKLVSVVFGTIQVKNDLHKQSPKRLRYATAFQTVVIVISIMIPGNALITTRDRLTLPRMDAEQMIEPIVLFPITRFRVYVFACMQRPSGG